LYRKSRLWRFPCAFRRKCSVGGTKADRDLALPTVGAKARAARHWCESISGIDGPPDIGQPAQWEYLLLTESIYRANVGASFAALLGLMRLAREQVIAEQQGTLF
jgi:hypothetical protein